MTPLLKVKVDRYTHQDHIDHILPCPQITSDADKSLLASTSSRQEDDITMPIDDSELQVNNDTADLVSLHPWPFKRLTED